MVAPSGLEDENDPLREARAYNRCIYLFVGMPYLLLGGLGVLAYRNIRALRKRDRDAGIDPTGT